MKKILATFALLLAGGVCFAQGTSTGGGQGSGGGGVTSVSCVSGCTVATPTTTPAITITGGGGSVTTVSVGNLAPLFTSSVATATTTPAITYSLTNAGAGTVFGNAAGTAGAPSYTSTPVLGLSGTIGTIGFGNATSGVVTLGTVAGALGTVTASLPANTGTIAETNLAQSFSALQTFGTNISIGGVTPTGATGTGLLVFGSSPTLITPALGTPSALVLTNATGLPVGGGGTGLATLTSNVIYKGNGASAMAVSSMTDNATTVTTTDTGGYVAPVFVSSGTTAGFFDFPQGTTNAVVAPCNTATSICWQAPTAVTSYLTTLPGVAPDIASYKQTDGCAAAACTETFHPVPVLLTVASDFTDSTSTSLQLITGLSTTLPVSKAVVVSFHCGIIFDQASAVVSDQFGIGITGTAPTQANAGANVFITASTVTAGTLTALASTTPTAVVTFTPGVATTIYRAEMDGTVEQPSNATPGVLGFYVATTTGTDNIIVKRGSFCSVQYQ